MAALMLCVGWIIIAAGLHAFPDAQGPVARRWTLGVVAFGFGLVATSLVMTHVPPLHVEDADLWARERDWSARPASERDFDNARLSTVFSTIILGLLVASGLIRAGLAVGEFATLMALVVIILLLVGATAPHWNNPGDDDINFLAASNTAGAPPPRRELHRG